MPAGDNGLTSHKHRLRRAVTWLDQQARDDPRVVEEACRRFDLSPADEAFLQDMWRRRSRYRRGGQGEA